MNLDEIKTAVREGKTVHWGNVGYVVRRSEVSGREEFSIVFTPNGHSIGLTWRDEVTMNGKPGDFFLAE